MGVRISPPVLKLLNKKVMDTITKYFKESYVEFVQRATWPSWASLQRSTIVVIVGSLVFALGIFVMDKVITQVLDFIYKLFA
tara:strand:- start:61 stop:306 length:246 start_codon:yes stop_codon:yes gene_type:complete